MLLYRKFVKGRNVVVERGNLETKSEAYNGLYRYRKHKWMLVPVNPLEDSEYLL